MDTNKHNDKEEVPALEEYIKEILARIDRIDIDISNNPAPSHWSIFREIPINYFNFNKKRVETHLPGWICNILYADCSAEQINEKIKDNFGPGSYAVCLEDSLGQIISSKKIEIPCELYDKNYSDTTHVDKDVARKIYNYLKFDYETHGLEDIVTLILSKIYRNRNIKVRGGFIDLDILAEDTNVEKKLVIDIARGYIMFNECSLKSFLCIKDIDIKGIGLIKILKRKRWDWI